MKNYLYGRFSDKQKRRIVKVKEKMCGKAQDRSDIRDPRKEALEGKIQPT